MFHFERSKASFDNWLKLSKFVLPGIRKHRPERDLPGQPSHVDGQPVPKQKTQVTEYVFDLTALRKHYRSELRRQAAERARALRLGI